LLGYNGGSVSFVYLGSLRTCYFQSLTNKIYLKLVSWEAKSLSIIIGRIQLVNHEGTIMFKG